MIIMYHFASLLNFIAPSPPFRDDQAVNAHTTRAPAPIQPIRVEGPDLWSQMELVDTMIEQSLVSSTGGARNSECVDCVGGVSEAGWGCCGGWGVVVRPDCPRPPWRRHQGGMPVLVSSETPRRLQQRGLLLVAERIDGAIVGL
jgi:hypothetical protein